MTDQIHHFRNAFVAHNSRHDFRPLTDLCESIIFCSTGYEPEEELVSAVETAMEPFDPRKDIIVPVGNVVSNLILGAVAARKATYLITRINPDIGGSLEDNVEMSRPTFFVAVYRDQQYHVREMMLLGKESKDNE
jgi:hypothetical protein